MGERALQRRAACAGCEHGFGGGRPAAGRAGGGNSTEDYVAEVGVRLSLYKRLASAGNEAEVDELAQEMEDRFGPPPMEAQTLVRLMRIKTELRRLMVLGCEASAKSVSLHLRDDTPLDPAKIGALVGLKKSPYRISPDGRLTRRAAEGEKYADGLALADKMLSELAECMKVDPQ